jgi:putative addiction module component (TIGR02574 family)
MGQGFCMPSGDAKLTDAALRLPPKKRARLASALMDSLASKREREIAEAWADEAQSRSKAYRQGKLKSLSVEEAFGFKL